MVPMTRTTALHKSAGLPNPIFMTGGAVRQDRPLNVMTCNECQREVVWATSNRTGRMYLVNVSRGHLDQRFYVKADAHDCNVIHELHRQMDEAAAQAEKAQEFGEFFGRCQKTRSRILRTYPEIHVDRLIAAYMTSVESETWDALDDLEDEMMRAAMA